MDLKHIEKNFQHVLDSYGTPQDLEDALQQEIDRTLSRLQKLQNTGAIDYRTFIKNRNTVLDQAKDMRDLMDNFLQRLLMKGKFKSCMNFLKSYIFFMNWSLNTFFESFIYFTIALSLVLLVLDDPNDDPDSAKHQNLKKMNQIVTWIFITEAILRIGATGFYYSSLPH